MNPLAKERELPIDVKTLTASHKDAVGASFGTESALYEEFYKKISGHAETHRQITLNNLSSVEERLVALKEDAALLKDSIFYHEEEVVVDRSKIIRNTESAVHDHNVAILDYDRLNVLKVIDDANDLSRSLLVGKADFFKMQEREYLQALIATEDYFEFYMQKSTEFQTILSRYETEIAKIFQSLDAEIEGMDTMIGKIIRDKNAKVAGIERFYDREMKHYRDNQYTYSAEPDPTSIEIQAIASDSDQPVQRLPRPLPRPRPEHPHGAGKRLPRRLRPRLPASPPPRLLPPRRQVRLLRRPGPLPRPGEAPGRRDRLAGKAARPLGRRPPPRRARSLAEAQGTRGRRADRMLRRQLYEKKHLLLLAEADTAKKIGKMATSLDEYLAVIEIDPFLAQTLGDESSQAIKDERLELSMLRVNKELKTNINYDIQSAKIKSQINGLETKLTHTVNREMLAEESELLQKIADINDFVIESRARLRALRFGVARERLQLARVERAVNVHLAWLVDGLNTDRMWPSLVFDELIKQVRLGETHEVYVVEAKAEIELLLKQYEMKAIHFKTAYENELAFLVMQKSRIGEETKINHEFILTTYKNQMRFAEEQITFAQTEYRLRLEALADAVDDERKFHQESIQNVRDRFEKEIRLAEDEYQARLYHRGPAPAAGRGCEEAQVDPRRARPSAPAARQPGEHACGDAVRRPGDLQGHPRTCASRRLPRGRDPRSRRAARRDDFRIHRTLPIRPRPLRSAETLSGKQRRHHGPGLLRHPREDQRPPPFRAQARRGPPRRTDGTAPRPLPRGLLPADRRLRQDPVHGARGCDHDVPRTERDDLPDRPRIRRERTISPRPPRSTPPRRRTVRPTKPPAPN
ncbi:MAG: hypothetical protein MZU97_11445 [Bacillus subtilis]|nr:hypothetical protein [Bacillus subtilis]